MKLNNRQFADFSVAMLTEEVFSADNVRHSVSHENRLCYKADKTEKISFWKKNDVGCYGEEK